MKKFNFKVFKEDSKLTTGVGFCTKTTHYRGETVKLQIWDFSGEERFKLLLSSYVKGWNGAMIIYDVANSKTLKDIFEWIEILRN